MRATTIGILAGSVAFIAGASLIYWGVADKEDEARARIKELIGSSLLFTGAGTIVASGIKALQNANGDKKRRYPKENPAKCLPGSRVQTLLFPKSWGVTKSKAWARKHGYKTGKVDVGPQSIRLRQESPGRFQRLRTIKLGRGVKAVVGWQQGCPA